MADPVFIVRNAVGAVVMDSRDAVAGACVDMLEIAAGATPTYTYPEFVGRSAIVLDAGSGYGDGIAIDTALGYPRLIAASRLYLRSLAVMVI
jgi:hypothetical protein